MSQIVSGPQRLDPYRSFTVRVFDGSSVYSGSKATGLVPTPDVANYRNGDTSTSSHKLPGRTKYDPITLTRGVTHDVTFSNWASQVWAYASGVGSEVPPANFRKDIYLEFYNEAGQLVVRYQMSGGLLAESPRLPAGGVVLHRLDPPGAATSPAQLAAIFEASLRRLKP